MRISVFQYVLFLETIKENLNYSADIQDRRPNFPVKILFAKEHLEFTFFSLLVFQ